MSTNQASPIIRAFSPDNDRHIRSLISLFQRTYGEDYPFMNIYRPQFWRSHIGRRFTSLVAILDGDVVAHVAIQPNPNNLTTVQLSYPAFDRSALDHEEKIRDKFQEIILSQLKRKAAAISLDLEILSPLFKSGFSKAIIDSSEVAIIPGYLLAPLRETKRSGNNRISLLVRQKVINYQSNSTIKLSAPRKHHAICQQLFKNIGLTRDLISSPDNQISSNLTFSADLRPWRINYYPIHGLTHLFVQPSLIGKENRSSLRKLTGLDKTVIAYIDMRDPQCALFCESLEELGYKFSGVMTAYHERENIIYTNTSESSIEIEELNSECSKALAHYIENNDWSAVHTSINTTFQSRAENLS